MSGFDLFLKKYRVRSTIILFSALYMVYDAAKWGMLFAAGNSRNGMEIAAILTAVQAPSVFFAGWAFKIYSETKLA